MFGSLLTSAAAGKRQGNIESRQVAVDAEDFTYQVYVPPQIKKGGKLPVIVFLHGIRERGSGGFVPTTGAVGGIVRHYFGQIPAIVLLPQCRQGSYWQDSVMQQMVMNALSQIVEEFGVDERRVYLTGVSMGGYGVWTFASKHPTMFAALVSICGGSPVMEGERFAPIARAVGKTPARLFHGADDRVVPASESRQMVKALEANGGNVRYDEYENVGHNVWLNVLSEKDLLPWLLAQQLG